MKTAAEIDKDELRQLDQFKEAMGQLRTDEIERLKQVGERSDVTAM
jgi:hypothetical protein